MIKPRRSNFSLLIGVVLVCVIAFLSMYAHAGKGSSAPPRAAAPSVARAQPPPQPVSRPPPVAQPVSKPAAAQPVSKPASVSSPVNTGIVSNVNEKKSFPKEGDPSFVGPVQPKKQPSTPATSKPEVQTIEKKSEFPKVDNKHKPVVDTKKSNDVIVANINDKKSDSKEETKPEKI
ncbi:predicted protein, partial [Naegleria gruberi]